MLFDCESDVANNCVPLFSMELFVSSNVGNFRNHSVSMDPNVFEETKVSPNTKNNENFPRGHKFRGHILGRLGIYQRIIYD